MRDGALVGRKTIVRCVNVPYLGEGGKRRSSDGKVLDVLKHKFDETRRKRRNLYLRNNPGNVNETDDAP